MAVVSPFQRVVVVRHSTCDSVEAEIKFTYVYARQAIVRLFQSIWGSLAICRRKSVCAFEFSFSFVRVNLRKWLSRLRSRAMQSPRTKQKRIERRNREKSNNNKNKQSSTKWLLPPVSNYNNFHFVDRNHSSPQWKLHARRVANWLFIVESFSIVLRLSLVLCAHFLWNENNVNPSYASLYLSWD